MNQEGNGEGYMGNEFFENLSETLSRTAKDLSEKAENLYESQKLRNQISGEERLVNRTMRNLGNLIYKRYEKGEAVDEEVAALCGEICQHKNKIEELKKTAAGRRGEKICKSCQNVIAGDASFCPYCGEPYMGEKEMKEEEKEEKKEKEDLEEGSEQE